MKKIYILTAVFALLTLSLNAQRLDFNPDNLKLQNVQNNNAASFINQLRGTKGVSSIMPEIYDGTPAQGLLRAPLRINSDEVTVGPFEGDNFSQNGLGFGNAYSNAQMVLIETDLLRSEYADFIGEEILGFRLALAGDATQTVQVGEFIAWPTNSNGSWDQNNRYSWSIGELTSGTPQPYTQYEKITSTNDLESGAEYLIVCENNNVAFDGSRTNLDVASNTISVTPSNGIIASTATTDAATFTITANGSSYSIRSKSGYYIGRTTNSNGMNTNQNTAYTNNITFNNGNATIAGQYRYLRYLATQGNMRFRYYNTNSGAQNIQLYKKVTVTPSAPAYVALQAGQWHEFYLDNPVVFNVDNDNAGLSLGYTYIQYPTGTSGQNLFPIAVNPQSTTHDHYAYLTTTTQGNGDIIITVPSYNTMFQTITVTDNNTGRTLTSWSSAESTVTDGTYEFYQMPTGWTLSGVYMFTYTTSGYTFGYLSSENQASITISSSLLNGSTNVSVAIAGAALEDGQYVDVNGDSRSLTSGYLFSQTWNPVDLSGGSSTTTGFNYYDFSQYGDLAVQLIFKSNMPKTDTPTITVGDPTATDVTVTATATDPTAEVTLTIGDRTETGIGSVSITIDRGTADQNLTATATAQEDGKRVSDEATAPVYVPALPITATPVITYEVVGNNMVITATGNGTVTLEADGQSASGDGSAQIIIPLGNDERTVTATATAIEPNHQRSATATETINIPEFGRSPMPNITMTNNGDGTYTITVTGTGDLAVYIDDDEHGGTAGDPIATGNGSVSFTVEEHSNAMTITIQATNQEGDLAISRTAEQTYTIPAMTIDSDFKLLDPQPETSESPIDLSKLMFVDRFSVDIPNDNSHPFMYEYTLEETQVRQRSSNSVDVYAEHTGSNGKGFYTLSQIDNDTTASLVMNVRNAAMDFNLSELSAPFFYTVEREEESEGETYWGWNAILQRTSVGNYKQTLKYDTKGNLLYNYNDTIFPGEHIQLDLDTITGSYNDYNAYVPVVWTMGFDRVNYNEDDPVHNSYGASVWTTGVAEVTMDTENAPLARVQRGWNTKWSDNNGEKCSLFMLDNVWATATMPTVNTLDYEPYMFRIFVKSKENKLRPYKYVEKDGNTVITAGEGTTNGPICVWNGYINDPDNAHKGVEISYTPGDEDHGMTITFNKNRVIREDANDDWTLSDENAMFGALESIAVSGYDSNGDPVLHDISTDDLEVFVRFYYIVEGIAEGHTPWAPTRDGNGDGEGPAGYGAESDPGGAGVATSVSEVRYHGEVVSKTYYNVQGIKSEQPFSGVNIVVTRYSDGATVVTKVMK